MEGALRITGQLSGLKPNSEYGFHSGSGRFAASLRGAPPQSVPTGRFGTVTRTIPTPVSTDSTILARCTTAMRARTGHFSPLLQTNPQSHLPNPLLWHRTCISTPMSPEIALTELRGGLVTVLWIAGPMLLAVLIVGVVIGVVQAATQLNEPTIGFVAKAVALTATLFATGSMLLGHLVEFTIELFHRIPHLIG